MSGWKGRYFELELGIEVVVLLVIYFYGVGEVEFFGCVIEFFLGLVLWYGGLGGMEWEVWLGIVGVMILYYFIYFLLLLIDIEF